MARNRELAQENRQLYEHCRDNGHMEFLRLAEKCDAYVSGEQWDPVVRAKLSRRNKPALTINRTLATFSALAGEQLARGGDISFLPSASGNVDTASALDKLWINFLHTNNLQWVKSRMFWDGVIRARGFLDLRVSFDDSMQGNPIVRYINSKDVLLFPEDSGYDPDEWTGVMLTRWMSVDQIAELYGVAKREISAMADTDALGSDYTDWSLDSFGTDRQGFDVLTSDIRTKYRRLRVLERQEWENRTAEVFVDRETGDVREVPASWDRERIGFVQAQQGYAIVRRRLKKIRWVVSVGNLTLHNRISPLPHLTPVPYFPMVIGGKPIGIVQQLISPQDMVNKTLSQELHIVAGIANSGYIVQQGRLMNMTMAQLRQHGAEDNLVLEVRGPVGDAIDKLKPNTVPTGLDRLSYKAQEALHDVSLVSESMQGTNRPDESGVVAQHKAARNVVSLGPVYASHDESTRILARNWLDLTQRYVTEERIVRVTRQRNTRDIEEVPVNQPQPDGTILNDLTVGEYGINIIDVPSRQTADESQYAQLIGMVKQGAPIPWSFIVDASSVYNKREIVEYLKEREGRGDPSEEDRMRQQLEMRMLQAEIADKESSASVKNAQAQKAQAEGAQKLTEASSTARGGNGEDPALAAAKLTADVRLKGEEARRKADDASALTAAKIEEIRHGMRLEERLADVKIAETMHGMALDEKKAEADAEAKATTQE